MDYLIEIAAWNLGFDEADELVEELVKVLEGRGLGQSAEDGEVRSLVVLRPQGMSRLDASSRPKLRRILRGLTRGARLIAIPGSDYRRRVERES